MTLRFNATAVKTANKNAFMTFDDLLYRLVVTLAITGIAAACVK